MTAHDTRVQIDVNEALVEWDVEGLAAGAKLVTPWGHVWLGEEGGAGRRLLAEVEQGFTLVVHAGPVSLSEYLLPGRHELLLTELDRSDTHPRR
ncbi:MAG: hypothetical protein D6791_16505 [Chloroflexi bacterium]|nr:MAG: hypothetical protein D6791_16505 [Chloroflexota bacterium]